MALSDCPVCWDTPCTCQGDPTENLKCPHCTAVICICGHMYRAWPAKVLARHIQVLTEVLRETRLRDSGTV